MTVKFFLGTALVALPLLAFSTPQQQAFCTWKIANDSGYYEQLGESVAQLQKDTVELQILEFDPGKPEQYTQQVRELSGKIQSTAATISLLQAQWHAKEIAKLQEIFYPTAQPTPNIPTTSQQSTAVTGASTGTVTISDYWQAFLNKVKSYLVIQ